MNNSNFRITLRPYRSAFAAFYKDASRLKDLSSSSANLRRRRRKPVKIELYNDVT